MKGSMRMPARRWRAGIFNRLPRMEFQWISMLWFPFPSGPAVCNRISNLQLFACRHPGFHVRVHLRIGAHLEIAFLSPGLQHESPGIDGWNFACAQQDFAEDVI